MTMSEMALSQRV